jgi:hypothetical protein
MSKEIKYQEVDVKTVMNYYVDGFKVPVECLDYFIDPVKGKIIFKLLVDSKEVTP